MECNKDEALRAKQIAENRMQSGDFVGALKFALKAKRLFPEVQNITQILTVCEVHCAAQNKISGSDMDWYRILQTEKFADEVTIKKQYRKLALLLHPDKNRSAGAEAAFKLIGEANRFLSDPMKRSSYDNRIRGPVETTTPKVHSQHSNRSSFGMKGDGNARNYQNIFHQHAQTWNSHQRDDRHTFWTACPRCNTRYQYYKTILNAPVQCQQCAVTFTAYETGYQGPSTSYPWSSSFTNHNGPPKHVPPKEASKSNSNGSRMEDMFVRSSPASMKKCTAGVGVRREVEKGKDGHVAAGVKKAGVGTSNPATSKAKESRTPSNVGSKRARKLASDLRDDKKAGNGNGMNDTNVQENGVDLSGLNSGVNPRRSSRKKQDVSYTETAEDGDFESSSKRTRQHESFNTIGLEKREAPTSDGLFNNNSASSFTAGVADQNGVTRNKASAPPKETVLRNKMEMEQSKKGESKSNCPPSVEICCPDPDFNDFEKDKADDCFAAGQLWAIYDTTDSMPRYYAFIRKVYSPFKLQITWLEADSNDQGEIDWHDADLPVACGKFKLGSCQRTTDRAMFSHQMDYRKGSERGSYLVCPKKGETWAIFRHWDIGWSSNPEKPSEYQFEYVEVLSDFDENVGVKVTYLGKVKGFVSLFQQTVWNGIGVFFVPPNELYRFSHRIPSYKMSGDEREGVPRGSFELDPAGLPISLFEVGNPGDLKMKDGMLNNGVNCATQESSKCEVKQAMSNESNHGANLCESNGAERVPPILRRSPRSNGKCMDNGQADTNQHMVREDGEDIDHRNYSQPEGTAVACQTNEKVKTPRKNEKNNCNRGTLNVRRSPRDISKRNDLGDAGECTTGKFTDNHSNASKNVKDSKFSQSVGSDHKYLRKNGMVTGASGYDIKGKSGEMFQCDQIWAIYGDGDNMPDTYVQIKKIEFSPTVRLHVSELEPCSPPKGFRRASCGIFKVKKAIQILSHSAFSHQLKVEPMANNIYEIYPRKGEIWALYEDQNYKLTSSGQGRGECHVVEVLTDGDKCIEVVVLMPVNGSQSIFKAPRIQRSKTGIVEILREEVGRFSHQIPAFQYSGEEDTYLRGCWRVDPSLVPGLVVEID